jgi:3-hydroxyacyl-CoA dehydrogenase
MAAVRPGVAPEEQAGMATGPVRVERIGRVAVAVLDLPGDRGLSPAARQGLAAALDGLTAEDRALVLIGEGGWLGGADLAAGEAPTLADLCVRIEALSVPVVAALAGATGSAGAALALAAHWRVVAADALVACGEAAVGMCPGGGLTQRLPRLAGAAAPSVLAGQAALPATALADRVVPGADALAEAAVAFAATAAGPRPTGQRRDGFADLAGLRDAIAGVRDGGPVAGRIADCVEAALLFPLAQGLAFEAVAVAELAATPAAAALSALAAAEARAVAAAASAEAPRTLAVYGAEGEAVARAAARAGLRVTLVEATEDTLRLALEAVAEALAADVAAGRIGAGAQAQAWSRVVPALAADPGEAALAGIALLAGPWAEAAALPDLAPEAVAVRLGRQAPGGLGLILAEGGRLAEVLAGGAVPQAQVARVVALARQLGRVPLVTRGRGIVAPLLSALAAAVRHQSARQGAAAVAGVVAGFGLASGPPAAQAEVELRLRSALANAALRLLGEEVAERPSDIDLALALGAGWRRDQPGPMLWAADRGALVLRADLARWSAEAPDLFTPAPLLDRLVRDGLPLAALEG